MGTKKKHIKKPKKEKCFLERCSSTITIAQQLIGKCTRCGGMFCPEHRYSKDHLCPALLIDSTEEDTARQEMIDAMRCVASKV